MDHSNKLWKTIDSRNERLWKKRFERLSTVEDLFLASSQKAESEGYERGVAEASLNLAALYFLNSRMESSMQYLNRAIQWLSKHKKERGYARAILLQGNIHESNGDYEKTLYYWLEALKIAREANARDSEAEACNQLGLVYFRLADYSKSLGYLRSGLNIRQELNDMNAVASSLNRIGMVLRQTRKYDESLDHYFRSLEIRRRNRQYGAIPWTLLGIASTYEDSGNWDKALENYLAGKVKSNERCMLQCFMGAGRIYSFKGEFDKAEMLLSDSLKIAKKLNTLYLIAEAYSSLSGHYERSGQAAAALENYKLFLKTRESLLSEEAQSRLRNIEISHAVERSEQEKEIFMLKNVELKKAYDIIEEKNRDITSSISYAERIQNAILPRVNEIRGLKSHLFILYLPKDIISGDFYWFTEKNGKIILVAGDCTGHGVPGALMSMLGISFLEEIVNKQEITSPSVILDELSREIRRALRQKGKFTDSKDGMDMSICLIDQKTGTVRYSGANNNLYVIREDELAEYKADRLAAGYNETPDRKFTEYEFKVLPGTLLYLFSDGYADQFGGPDNKKFKYSRLKDKLIGIHKLPLKDQKKQLEKEFTKWKGSNTQVDDVLVAGYRF